MFTLTPAQQKVMEFIAHYPKKWCASNYEIAAGTGLSDSQVIYLMQELDRKGFIEYEGSRQYAILWKL